MPLFDHFHPPLSDEVPWTSFHGTWAVVLADHINGQLPPRFTAMPFAGSGAAVEIDVAAFERKGESVRAMADNGGNGGVALMRPQVWSPPAPSLVMPAVFPSDFEVRIISTRSGPTLVGAIELVSPANKDRPETRRAFAAKCASYLYQGVSVIIMDIVTERLACLHNVIVEIMAAAEWFRLPDDAGPHAVAYRPVIRNERSEIDLWPAVFAIGDVLPTLPLRLTGDLFVPVEFEAAYLDACRRRSIR